MLLIYSSPVLETDLFYPSINNTKKISFHIEMKHRVQPPYGFISKAICHWLGMQRVAVCLSPKAWMGRRFGDAVIEWLYQFNYSIIDMNWGIKLRHKSIKQSVPHGRKIFSVISRVWAAAGIKSSHHNFLW